MKTWLKSLMTLQNSITSISVTKDILLKSPIFDISLKNDERGQKFVICWDCVPEFTERSDILTPSFHTEYVCRGFSVAGPQLWNSLPPHVRQHMDDKEQLKKLLKT